MHDEDWNLNQTRRSYLANTGRAHLMPLAESDFKKEKKLLLMNTAVVHSC